MHLGRGHTTTLKEDGAEVVGEGGRGREVHILKQ